jgi:predicted RNase H-like nuclease
MSPPVAGVDGMRGGWVVAVVHAPDRVTWSAVPDAAAVLDRAGECRAVGVDVPIGLPARGRRACDVAAAARLGSARSSVFPAPVRAVLDAGGYSEACTLARSVDGRAVSRQAWNLVPKIAEWAAALSPGERRVVEVHPELSFRAMAPATRFAAKRTARGVGQRLAALRGFVDSGAVLADLPAGPGLDDALDALAAAWSALRWSAGTAEVLGDTLTTEGTPMRIAV